MHEPVWMPHIQTVRCSGCGICVTQCPTSALALRDGKVILLAPNHCVYCALCEECCPVAAIQLPYLVVRRREQ